VIVTIITDIRGVGVIIAIMIMIMIMITLEDDELVAMKNMNIQEKVEVMIMF